MAYWTVNLCRWRMADVSLVEANWRLADTSLQLAVQTRTELQVCERIIQ